MWRTPTQTWSPGRSGRRSTSSCWRRASTRMVSSPKATGGAMGRTPGSGGRRRRRRSKDPGEDHLLHLALAKRRHAPRSPARAANTTSSGRKSTCTRCSSPWLQEGRC